MENVLLNGIDEIAAVKVPGKVRRLTRLRVEVELADENERWRLAELDSVRLTGIKVALVAKVEGDKSDATCGIDGVEERVALPISVYVKDVVIGVQLLVLVWEDITDVLLVPDWLKVTVGDAQALWDCVVVIIFAEIACENVAE
jgi:hypothetical protein